MSGHSRPTAPPSTIASPNDTERVRRQLMLPDGQPLDDTGDTDDETWSTAAGRGNSDEGDATRLRMTGELAVRAMSLFRLIPEAKRELRSAERCPTALP